MVDIQREENRASGIILMDVYIGEIDWNCFSSLFLLLHLMGILRNQKIDWLDLPAVVLL